MRLCPTCATTLTGVDWRCGACTYAPEHRLGFAVLAPEVADAGTGFDPTAYVTLAAVEDSNFWFRARNRLILWALKQHRPDTMRHLEVGCGTGFVLSAVMRAFPEARVTGTELLVAGLPFAAARAGRAELIQLDARHLPFADEFDTIGAFDVLEHIQEDERVLDEMYRALRPGGVVLVTVPQHPWLWSSQDERAHHVRRYRARELREKVERAGFGVNLETSFVSLLLPLMWLSRLRQRAKYDSRLESSDELRPPWPIGRILETVMNIERKAIELGARFPAGGSRLLLATKPGKMP
jgi:SAM-dependent methyltransferase